jgi:hypothetical protein
MRSFDQRQHSYHGYVLRVDGTYGGESGEFQIAVGKAAHEKHQFRAGMEVSGLAVPVPDPKLETAGFYKTSGIKVSKESVAGASVPPTFKGVPPDLKTYRNRGHRRLDARTYESKCKTCIWGLPDASGDSGGPLEPIQEALPVRDVLLRPQKLFIL